MNSYLKCLYVAAAPQLACTLSAIALIGFFSVVKMDTMKQRIGDAVVRHLAEHNDVPISVIHDCVFLASKDIARGQEITVDSVEDTGFGASSGEDPRKAQRYVNRFVVGAMAKTSIRKGQLIANDDLQYSKKFDPEDEKDILVKSNDLGSWFLPFAGTFLLIGVSGAVAYLIGFGWLAVEAFRKSVMWGLGFLLVPFMGTVFELKNWQVSKKPFNLMVIGSALFGVLAGTTNSYLGISNTIFQLCSKTKTVLYSTHAIKKNAIFSVDDVVPRVVMDKNIPVDVKTDKLQVIGHTARTEIPSNWPIRAIDLSE